MKRLKDEAKLKTTFERISITDLRTRPGEVLTSVELGKAYLITRNDKPVAVLSAPPGETLMTTVSPQGKVDFASCGGVGMNAAELGAACRKLK